jgi:hypothetical protein
MLALELRVVSVALLLNPAKISRQF